MTARTGQLTERIGFGTPARTEDGEGGLTPAAFVAAFTVWASLEFPTGREFPEMAGRTVAEVDAVITIRYRTDIVAKEMLAQHGTALYDIEAVLPDLVTKQWLTLLAKRRST